MSQASNRETLRVSPIPSSPFRREVLVRSPLGEKILYWAITDESCPIGTGTLLDDALLALTPLAQFHGWDIHLDGDVTREQVANMREYQEAWAMLRPDIYTIVDVRYENIGGPGVIHHPTNAVLAFSGGVDSTHAAMTSNGTLRGARSLTVTRGVLVAGFDISLDDEAAISVAHSSAQRILDALDIDLVMVSTNWRSDFSRNYTMSFGLGLAAVLHQFRSRNDAGLIATDAPYTSEVGAWGRDTTINRLAGHRGFPFPTIGATETRRDKIAAIAHMDIVRENVRVCWQPTSHGSNCRRCGKCIRTKLGFAAAGYPETAALGKASQAELMSVELSMWDRIYLKDMLENPGMLSADLLAAIEQRLTDDRPSTEDEPTQGEERR